jgi:hypothetical protein
MSFTGWTNGGKAAQVGMRITLQSRNITATAMLAQVQLPSSTVFASRAQSSSVASNG